MSFKSYGQINSPQGVNKISHSNNYFDVFKEPLPVFRNNILFQPSSMDNKNGFSKNNIKRDLKSLDNSESGEKKIKLLTTQNNINSIFSQNDKQNLLNYTTFQDKYLEPKNNFHELGDFSTIPDFEKHLYNVTKRFKLNDQHFLLNPLISRLFTQKKNMEMIIFTQIEKDF